MKLHMIIDIPNCNPRDLFRGGPRLSNAESEEDGIHPEAQNLIDQLKKARSELDVHTIVWTMALEYFAQGYRSD